MSIQQDLVCRFIHCNRVRITTQHHHAQLLLVCTIKWVRLLLWGAAATTTIRLGLLSSLLHLQHLLLFLLLRSGRLCDKNMLHYFNLSCCILSVLKFMYRQGVCWSLTQVHLRSNIHWLLLLLWNMLLLRDDLHLLFKQGHLLLELIIGWWLIAWICC